MRKWLAFLLVIPCLFACSSIRTQTDTELPDLKKNPIYLEADYLTLVEAYSSTEKSDYSYILSGFLINYKDRYYAVTAGHIQDPTEKITKIIVYFKNKKNRGYSADLLGYDQLYDVAILGLQDKDFRFTGQTATLGNSDEVKVGDWVYALGHPLDSPWYISSGKVNRTDVKATYRPLDCLVIEHSAICGYGSSGGPLLDAGGRVIGMNTAIFVTKNQKVSGQVFAIPINQIKKRLDELISGYKQ